MTHAIYGLIAEFDNPTALVKAARAARDKGYRKLDAFSPFPIEGQTARQDIGAVPKLIHHGKNVLTGFF